MTERLTKRAEEIFYAAAEITSATDCAGFLDRECEGDPELRALVERWLAIRPQAEKFFAEIDPAKVLRQQQQ